MKQNSHTKNRSSQVKFKKQELLKTIDELTKLGQVSKKQKLNLIQQDQQFMHNFLLIIGFTMHAELISTSADCKSELKQQLKKLITRIDSKHVQSDENICACETYEEQDQVFIILTGQVSIKFISQETLRVTEKISSQAQKSSRKKSNKEEIQTKIINMDKEILPFLIDGQFVTKLVSLSEVKFLQIPKRSYDSFALWIHNKLSQVNINFLIQVLQLQTDDIKSYKLHRKPLIRIQKGQIVNLAKKNYGVLILRSGQLKLTYESCYKKQQNHVVKGFESLAKQSQQQVMQIVRSKNSDIIINPGSITHCLYPSQLRQAFMGNKQIKQICATKDSFLLNIDIFTLKQIFEFMPEFKGSLRKILKEIAIKRQNFITKSKSEAKKLSYDDSLRKMVFLNKKTFQTCKHVKQRFNIRRIEHNTGDQCVQFVSNYPFTKFMQSKQRVFKQILQKKQTRKNAVKAIAYLKRSQTKKKQKMQKMLKLKLKSIAQRQISGSDQQQIFNKDHIRKNIFEQNEDEPNEIQPSDYLNQSASLASNDTGIIHAFVKNSHSYQRKIRELIQTSQQNAQILRGQRMTNHKSQQNRKRNSQTLKKVMNRFSLGVDAFSAELQNKILQFQSNKYQLSEQFSFAQKMHKKSKSQQDLSCQFELSPYFVNGNNRCNIQCQSASKHEKYTNAIMRKKDCSKIFRKASSGKIRMFKCQSNKFQNCKTQKENLKIVRSKKEHRRINTLQNQKLNNQTIRV